MRKVCIQVPQHLGERVRRHLMKHELLDTAFPINKENSHLFFPLQHSLSEEDRKTLHALIGDLTIVTKELIPLTRKPSDLVTALVGKLPESLLDALPHSFDIIGDVAVVELNSHLSQYENLIGQAIMTVNSRVKTVYAKEGGVEGEYRVRPLRLLAGKAQTTTIHTEYGLQIAVDVTKTYFSPRLSTEHDRVAQLVQPGEIIVDMFTGVGPFALLFAKRHRVKVYAIDINKRAIQCLQKSLELNRLEGQVISLVGDARNIIDQSLIGKADRVIMNLPHGALEFLDAAIHALKPTGGIVHYYGITTEDYPLDALIDTVLTKISRCKRSGEVIHARNVRPSAPHEFQVVLDLQVSQSITSST
ncbi:MAG: class I SAM-dependent methyltransferase family protein [Candidatus Hodarchaeota archaeon]